jgi:hypothetical protein
MKTEDIKKMAQAWQQVQEASKKNEELVGNQHKLDHNKNGKVDAADFKGLRKKSKKNTETETVTSEETENLDEISRDTARSYIRKASAHKTTGETPKKDRSSGVELAGKKAYGIGGKAKVMATEEVEQIDEISKKTLGSYVKKASSDMANNAYALGARDPLKKPGSWDKAFKRKSGIEKATDKLVAKEEVELDEVSQKTLWSYHAKAGADLQKKREKLDKGTLTMKDLKKGQNRVKGLNRAANKMDEEAGWPVYERIKENRAMHYKGAAAPETMDDKLKGAGAKKMKSDFAGNTTDPDFEEKGHTDASKAGRITKKSPARTGDQSKGDTKIMNPVKDTTK